MNKQFFILCQLNLEYFPRKMINDVFQFIFDYRHAFYIIEMCFLFKFNKKVLHHDNVYVVNVCRKQYAHIWKMLMELMHNHQCYSMNIHILPVFIALSGFQKNNRIIEYKISRKSLKMLRSIQNDLFLLCYKMSHLIQFICVLIFINKCTLKRCFEKMKTLIVERKKQFDSWAFFSFCVCEWNKTVKWNRSTNIIINLFRKSKFKPKTKWKTHLRPRVAQINNNKKAHFDFHFNAERIRV